MKKLSTIIIIVLAISLKAYSQEEQKFTGDVLTFVNELSDYLKDQNDQTELFIEQLELFWASDTIDFDSKGRIIEYCNKIVPVAGINTEPVLRYVKIIATFYRNSYAHAQYETWNKAAMEIFKSADFSLINLINFLNFTEGIIYNSYINTTTTFTWKSSIHPSYKFNYTNKLTVNFDNINLTCINKKDSIYIKNTSGTYDPNTKTWAGNKGKITWIRSDYPEDEIFVNIDRKYNLDLSKNTFSIDSVWFTNKDYFDSPNLGTVTDKLLMDYKKNTIQYPEFQSYDKWFQIKDLFPNVNYEGGFTMRGSQLIGTGSNDKLATIIINRDGKEFLRAEGNILVFRRSILNSDKASVKVHFGQDSLYHTGLNFNYNNKSRIVTISPTDKLTTQSPIHSSYHKLSIWFNQLSWNIDANKMIFSAITGGSIGIAQFESDNFFNEELFDDMMGLNDRHPLFAIWSFSNQIKQKNFLASDFAVYLKKPMEQVRVEMMRIAKQGYILYDFSTDEVIVADKLTNAIQARHRKIDYDVIKFNSRCDGNTPNAILNIDSLDMRINGIENIQVSQTQNVNINPKNSTIVMRKNRNFEFAGALQAGLFNFYGENFAFNYENFRIDLKEVDIVQLDYQLNTYDNYGQRLLSSVTSTLEKITGNIMIDKPFNKSGLMKNPEYPIFNSTKQSYVYYDDPKIYNGIYRRDSIYFEIYPFSYTNLNNFEKEAMIFKGIFYSKNILAPIEDSLVLRPDNSLGFVHTIPDEGFALYEGKGRAFNQVDVSDQGIIVNGKITYITSTTTSPEMVLFPDSMITQSEEFTIDKRTSGIGFPKVTAQKHNIRWLPRRDKMYAKRGSEPFIMFENQAKLSGDLLLEPTGLTGKGTVVLSSAEMTAAKYEFNPDDYNSPAANLKLLNPNTKELSFTSNNVKAYIDFVDSIGTFERNDKSIYANLVPLKYDAHFDRFGWDMGNNELTIQTPKKQEFIADSKFYTRNMHPNDTSLNGSLFYSTQFGEDSLNFISPVATYSTVTSDLKASNVEHVITADAIVFPDEQKVDVSPSQRMHAFKNAVVNANIDSMFHRFYNAEISITGRKLYGGKGDYDYIDEEKKIQTIHFTHIKVDSALNTYAETAVALPDSFTLSPNFGYFGKINLLAPNKFLTFNGYTKPFYNCSNTTAEWFNFKAEIDPNNIFIPVDEKVRTQSLAFLTNGSVVREDTIKLYGGFFQKRFDYADKPFVEASGYLTYNKKNHRFTIAQKHKLQNPDTLGNSVSLQKDYCYLFSEGAINIPAKLGQVKLSSSGSITHKLDQRELNMDIVTKMDFFFNQAAIEMIATELNQLVTLSKVDLSRKIYKKALYDFVDLAEIPEVYRKIDLLGSNAEIPKGMAGTITFADLKMTWNPVTKSFISKGKLGIGSIGNIQVNKYVDGYLEIFKRRSGDVFNLFIKISEDRYYGFVYTKSTLQVVSSNDQFLAAINALSSKETKLKTKPGEPAYKYLVGTKKEIELVKKRHKDLIMGNVNNVTEPDSAETEEADTDDKK